MIVVNLFGAPGSGKSTGAAYIFAKLKMLGINVELVTEFAKDMVWCNNQEALSNQAYMFGQQLYRISRLENKVDIVITDSPILLSAVYNRAHLKTTTFYLGTEFENVVANTATSYPSLNYFINRVKPYNPTGRVHTEIESDELSAEILDMLNRYSINYNNIDGNEDGYNTVVSNILCIFNKEGGVGNSNENNLYIW